jgi:hypothetical protein
MAVVAVTGLLGIEVVPPSVDPLRWLAVQQLRPLVEIVGNARMKLMMQCALATSALLVPRVFGSS